MKTGTLRSLVALACLAYLPSAGWAASLPSHASQVSPKHVVLQIGDVPVGFSQIISAPFSLTKIAALNYVSVSVMRSKGYVSSWDTQFQRTAPSGAIGISDNVVVYRGKAGALWQVLRSKRVASRQYSQYHLVPLAVGHIGDQSLGECFQEEVSGANLKTCFVLFRRSSYAAFVAVTGFTGTFGAAIVVRYAKVMNARIAPVKGPASTPTPTNKHAPTPTVFRVGVWAVSLTGYSFTNRDPGALPSTKMEWLVTHWRVRNESASKHNLNDLDFSARTLGVLEVPDPFVLATFGYHGMPTAGYAEPGQLTKGTEIIPVFRGKSPVRVTFDPFEGNPSFDSHTWTITR